MSETRFDWTNPATAGAVAASSAAQPDRERVQMPKSLLLESGPRLLLKEGSGSVSRVGCRRRALLDEGTLRGRRFRRRRVVRRLDDDSHRMVRGDSLPMFPLASTVVKPCTKARTIPAKPLFRRLARVCTPPYTVTTVGRIGLALPHRNGRGGCRATGAPGNTEVAHLGTGVPAASGCSNRPAVGEVETIVSARRHHGRGRTETGPRPPATTISAEVLFSLAVTAFVIRASHARQRSSWRPSTPGPSLRASWVFLRCSAQ